MIGHSLFFSCLKKKGLTYGDFKGWIHPVASCSSTQQFISTISSCISEYSLEERCPGSVLNSILMSKSRWEQGSSSLCFTENQRVEAGPIGGGGQSQESKCPGYL